MNYANIKYCDIANGPGVRTTLFVSGCRVHCPGCFNEVAWDFCSGEVFDDAVAQRIWDSLEAPWVEGLTVLGGEPFEPENQAALRPFLEETRRRFPAKSIWCFTGYLLDRDILPVGGRKRTPDTDGMLACLDVLVDGPFLQAEYDISLRFRGSANQRIIDVPATLAAYQAALSRNEGLAAFSPVIWHDQKLYETRGL